MPTPFVYSPAAKRLYLVTGTVAFSGGWAGFTGGEAPLLRRTPDGLVLLSGLITGGTTTDGTVLGTLPSGFRPAAGLVRFSCVTAAGFADIAVRADGAIIGYGGLNSGWTSLGGIAFAAA